MESIYAIAGGLALRVALSAIARVHSPLSNHALSYKDDLSSTLANIEKASTSGLRLTSALVGLWEGVVTLHFLKKMPNSFDPYVAYAVRLFIDLIVTESLERLIVVVVWTVLGMILADVTPPIWREMGLHRIWRRTRRDLYSMQRAVEKGIPKIRFRFRVPALPKVRVVRFGEDNDREQRERERDQRRRERRERRHAPNEESEDEEEEEPTLAAAPESVPASSILQLPPSTLGSTVASARRRASPTAELASILESPASTSATSVLLAESAVRHSRQWEPERERVKERERVPISLPTPSNTTVTAPSRPYHRYEPEPSEAGTASPAVSSTSTNDLAFEIDYSPELDDDNRSSSAASFTAASSPQFTSASNLTPRIDLLSPPGTDPFEYIGLPAESSTPAYLQQPVPSQKLQFLDTAIDNAPEVDAEEELMSDVAAEEEMLAIAGGMNRYSDEFDFEYEDRAATPKPRRNPYLPPTPSDSAAPFGRRTFARRELPQDNSSILSNEPREEEKVVVPSPPFIKQIPDDIEKQAAHNEEVKEDRPPTPPAKDDSYRATPPPAAPAKLRSSSKKAASALGVPTSTEKIKKSSKSKSVISEGAETPKLSTLAVPPAISEVAAPASPPVEQPIHVAPALMSLATTGLKPPAPVGIALITPISADRSAANIPAPPLLAPSYAPFNIPQPPPPGTPASVLGGFGNPGVPGLDDEFATTRGLPPAYLDWSGSNYGHVDDEDDMYLDEDTSKIQIEAFKQKEKERAAQEAMAQSAAQALVVQTMQQQTPDQTFAVEAPAPLAVDMPLVSSPTAESPLPSPISPLSPIRPKDRNGRTGHGSVQTKKTDPVKSLVSHWNTLSDATKGKSQSDIGMGGARLSRRSTSASASRTAIGGPTRPPVLRRTSGPISPSGISYAGFGTPSKAATKSKDEEEDRKKAEALALEQEKVRAEEEEKERKRQAEEEERQRQAAAAAEAEAEAEQRRLEEERLREEAAAAAEEEKKAQEEEQRRLRQEEESRLVAEEAQRLQEEVEARRLEEEAKEAKRLQEEQERREAEEKARQEAEEQARREAEEQTRREAQERAQREAEERARQEAEAERVRLEEEQARKKAEEEEAEAKRLKKEEKKRKKAEEKARKEAEERRKQEEEAAELERKRQEEEAAVKERQRLEQEEAERERQRLAEEAELQRLAEQEAERQRLAEEEAERERLRKEEQEKERLRIQREKDQEEERLTKARKKEQERQWKLEQAERKSELAAAIKAKSELAVVATKSTTAKKATSALSAAAASNIDRDKDLPPPPPVPEVGEVAPSVPSAFGPGLDTNWRPEADQQPAANAVLGDEIGNPWDAPADRPQTPTQETVNLAGIGAGGRSEVGRSAVGRHKSNSPGPEIDVKSASENQYATPGDDDAEAAAEEEEEDGANEPEGLLVRPDDLASVSAVTEATEVSQDIEKRLRKALLLRAQKADLEQQLQALKGKSDASADEVKAAERVVRKYEKKIRRLYEDCQVQTFFYPSAEAASAILLHGVSNEVARDHINEALLWHLTPEARSFSFTVTVPAKNKKTSAQDKAMRAASLEYLQMELKLNPTNSEANKKLFTVGVPESRWDEWIADLRRATTSADS